MFSDMPADHIVEMYRKEPSLPQQPATTVIAAATHFSTGISIVCTHTRDVLLIELTTVLVIKL